jgi:cytochrome c oxidase cbb3-type subunit III
MSSRCRNHSRFLQAVPLFVAAFACAASAHAQPPGTSPAAQSGPPTVAVSRLFPGHGSPPPEDPVAKQYQGNPQAIADGKRLFQWMNCSGCHFQGGGGMGVALMSGLWHYGGRLDQIYESIAQGRPNGMPSWQGKLAPGEIWALAAYVKSLAAPSEASGPGQTLAGLPAPPVPIPAPKSSAPAAPNAAKQ